MDEKPLQSIAGLIRVRLASIEESMRSGIKQESIVKQLNDEGFSMTLGTFRTNLIRARISRDKDKAAAVANQAKPTKAARLDEAEKPKQPSPVLNLNQHGGFTMPPPLSPEELF